MGVRIEGLEDVMSMLDNAPAEMIKDARKASGDAAKEVVRDLRPKIPQKYRKLVGSSVQMLSDGTLSTWIGLFNRKKHPGLWNIGYWQNYGTLTKRDPSHHFVRPVRSGVKRRNNTGQEPRNFWEGPSAMNAEKFLEAFKRRLKEQGYQID